MSEDKNLQPEKMIKIAFKTFTQETFTLNLLQSETIFDVKFKIKSLRNVAIDAQVLLFKGKVLDDEATVKSCNIDSEILFVIDETLTKNIKLTFKDFHTQNTFKLEFARTDNMEVVANKVAEVRSDDVFLILIYDGKLLRGSYHTVNSLGYTADKCILVVGDQKIHNETTQELEALRNKQLNESNRRYGDSFYLSEIEDTLSKILEVADSKTIPGDLVKKLRLVHEHSIKLIGSRYDSTEACVQIVDDIAANRILERDAFRLHSRVEMMSKVISRMDNCVKLNDHPQKKKSLFSKSDDSTQNVLASIAADFSMLNHLIDDALELLLEDNFSRDIVEISYDALESAKIISTSLREDFAKARSTQSIEVGIITQRVESLFQCIGGILSIVVQSTGEFLENEMMKQIVIQGRFVFLKPVSKPTQKGDCKLILCKDANGELELPDNFKALCNLIVNYNFQQREMLVVLLMKMAVDKMQKNSSKNNSEYVKMLLILAERYRGDDNEKAVKMLTEIVDVKINYLGVEADSNEVYSILNIISGMCGRMNIFEKSLEIRETIYGKDHNFVAEELHSIASRLPKEKAEIYYKRALAIYEAQGDKYSEKCKEIKSKLETKEVETKKQAST